MKYHSECRNSCSMKMLTIFHKSYLFRLYYCRVQIARIGKYLFNWSYFCLCRNYTLKYDKNMMEAYFPLILRP